MSDRLLGIIMQKPCGTRLTASEFCSLPSMDLCAYLATSNITDAILLQPLPICPLTDGDLFVYSHISRFYCWLTVLYRCPAIHS
jgi:hypothetical protein